MSKIFRNIVYSPGEILVRDATNSDSREFPNAKILVEIELETRNKQELSRIVRILKARLKRSHLHFRNSLIVLGYLLLKGSEECAASIQESLKGGVLPQALTYHLQKISRPILLSRERRIVAGFEILMANNGQRLRAERSEKYSYEAVLLKIGYSGPFGAPRRVQSDRNQMGQGPPHFTPIYSKDHAINDWPSMRERADASQLTFHSNGSYRTSHHLSSSLETNSAKEQLNAVQHNLPESQTPDFKDDLTFQSAYPDATTNGMRGLRDLSIIPDRRMESAMLSGEERRKAADKLTKALEEASYQHETHVEANIYQQPADEIAELEEADADDYYREPEIAKIHVNHPPLHAFSPYLGPLPRRRSFTAEDLMEQKTFNEVKSLAPTKEVNMPVAEGYHANSSLDNMRTAGGPENEEPMNKVRELGEKSSPQGSDQPSDHQQQIYPLSLKPNALELGSQNSTAALEVQHSQPAIDYTLFTTSGKTEMKAKKEKPINMIYSDNDLGPEEKLAKIPRYAFVPEENTETSLVGAVTIPGVGGLSDLEVESSMSTLTTEAKLGDYFPTGTPNAYTDGDCQAISVLLQRSGRSTWSVAPRLYIILRIIGQLQHLDSFLDQAIDDLWLPFTTASLPRTLSLAYHDEFLKTQQFVLTKAINLENGGKGHAHFTKDDPFPFEVKGSLGQGGYGFVDKIMSSLSGREFARKRFRRVKGLRKRELQSFMTELKILKRLHHIHCVELVASYTDPKYFGIIIAPVADCDLAAYYSVTTPESRVLLRSFCGCLANAVDFLHDAKIRHRDIKPQNILVKGPNVYLTDFGISLDWENLSRSTTTKDSAKSMLYCAPEVARFERRNTSADIWSLGCVFLEMLTIIKGKSIQDQRDFFCLNNSNYRFYENITAAVQWVGQLQQMEEQNDPDIRLSEIILEMLQEDADGRIPSAVLASRLSRYKIPKSRMNNPLCGECCSDDSHSISDSGSDRDPFEDSD